MNTKIKLTYKDVPYVLEFDRMSIKTLESHGFSVEEFIKKPMLNIELAFAGLFIKNHRKTKQQVIDEIFSKTRDKEKLVETIIQMIEETYTALFDEPEGDEGNAEWEVVDLSPKKDQK